MALTKQRKLIYWIKGTMYDLFPLNCEKRRTPAGQGRPRSCFWWVSFFLLHDLPLLVMMMQVFRVDKRAGSNSEADRYKRNSRQLLFSFFPPFTHTDRGSLAFIGESNWLASTNDVQYNAIWRLVTDQYKGIHTDWSSWGSPSDWQDFMNATVWMM